MFKFSRQTIRRLVYNAYTQKKTHYEILKISQKASMSEIKKAFKKLAKKYHPDQNPQHEGDFREINEAYQILSNQQQRNDYDFKLQAETKTSKTLTKKDFDFKSHGQNQRKERESSTEVDFEEFEKIR